LTRNVSDVVVVETFTRQQMASFESNKGSLPDAGDEDAAGEELSGCALAMLERERESLLSPSESPGAAFSSGSSSSSLQAAAPLLGYDVEFDPPLESKYECPICLMALRNAIQTPCGHRFCKNCIEKSIRYAASLLFSSDPTPTDSDILRPRRSQRVPLLSCGKQ